MVRLRLERASITLAAVLLLVSIGSTTALAHDVGHDDAIDLGSHDVRITDATIHVDDVHVTGTGLPERSVDRSALTVDTELSIDGFAFAVNGHTVQVGHTHVVFEDVGVVVEDVSVGGEASGER